ncbi:MAG: TlpA family protein disulfide reductase [Syntrophaceae bacterium]|nr:TlpA family protein disulfide reductase [Syntrophaceae bacterium]
MFSWLTILCLCVGCLFFLPGCGKGKKEPSFPTVPDFTLKTLDGGEIVLSRLKEKVILLDFWATWCRPCREAIPHLIRLYKNYQKEGLEVIGMNMDRGNLDAVRHFVKSMEIPYPVALAPENMEKSYGVSGLPTTILIDKKGRIREKIVGFTNEISKQMTGRVLDLLSEKP